jgi:hypothetical protein
MFSDVIFDAEIDSELCKSVNPTLTRTPLFCRRALLRKNAELKVIKTLLLFTPSILAIARTILIRI